MELITGYLCIMGFFYLLAGGIYLGVALYNYSVSLFALVYCFLMFIFWNKYLFRPKAFFVKIFICVISLIAIISIAEYLKLDMNSLYIRFYIHSLEILITIIALLNFILFFRTIYILNKNKDEHINNYIVYNLPITEPNSIEDMEEYEKHMKKLKLF